VQKIKIISDIHNRPFRLDKFLTEEIQKSCPDLTRSKIQNLIKNGNVLDKNSDPIVQINKKVLGGDEFYITIPEPEPSHLEPKNIPFGIVFEDADLVLVNKPSGLTTHPGAGNKDHTLVNALLYFYQNNLSQIGGEFRPGIVHRLDKNTSGLMLVAKNDFAHQKLSTAIANREIERKYLAFCFGVPIPNFGKIDKNIDRSKKHRLRMCTVQEGGKKAVTNYKIIKNYSNAVSLVECKLETGRTHQIRVHMTSIGHSLIGDYDYGNKNKIIGKISADLQSFISKFDRQALHSYKIAFMHPRSEKLMEFEIDLPDDMKELKSRLGQ
jgi:23S rRNA pseudouridine1911/1915/1917 synthase